MTPLLILLAFVSSLVFVWWRQSIKFQRNMKVGDKCVFYLGHERHEGRITFVGDIVHIRYVYGIILKDRSTVYPSKWWL